MTTLKSKAENPTGLHQRYIVTKADGSLVDPDAVYFVMRLDDGGKDSTHIEAGREAAMRWAQSIISMGDKSKHLHQVANDVIQLVNQYWGARPLQEAAK